MSDENQYRYKDLADDGIDKGELQIQQIEQKQHVSISPQRQRVYEQPESDHLSEILHNEILSSDQNKNNTEEEPRYDDQNKDNITDDTDTKKLIDLLERQTQQLTTLSSRSNDLVKENSLLRNRIMHLNDILTTYNSTIRDKFETSETETETETKKQFDRVEQETKKDNDDLLVVKAKYSNAQKENRLLHQQVDILSSDLSNAFNAVSNKDIQLSKVSQQNTSFLQKIRVLEREHKLLLQRSFTKNKEMSALRLETKKQKDCLTMQEQINHNLSEKLKNVENNNHELEVEVEQLSNKTCTLLTTVQELDTQLNTANYEIDSLEKKSNRLSREIENHQKTELSYEQTISELKRCQNVYMNSEKPKLTLEIRNLKSEKQNIQKQLTMKTSLHQNLQEELDKTLSEWKSQKQQQHMTWQSMFSELMSGDINGFCEVCGADFAGDGSSNKASSSVSNRIKLSESYQNQLYQKLQEKHKQELVIKDMRIKELSKDVESKKNSFEQLLREKRATECKFVHLKRIHAEEQKEDGECFQEHDMNYIENKGGVDVEINSMSNHTIGRRYRNLITQLANAEKQLEGELQKRLELERIINENSSISISDDEHEKRNMLQELRHIKQTVIPKIHQENEVKLKESNRKFLELKHKTLKEVTLEKENLGNKLVSERKHFELVLHTNKKEYDTRLQDLSFQLMKHEQDSMSLRQKYDNQLDQSKRELEKAQVQNKEVVCNAQKKLLEERQACKKLLQQNKEYHAKIKDVKYEKNTIQNLFTEIEQQKEVLESNLENMKAHNLILSNELSRNIDLVQKRGKDERKARSQFKEAVLKLEEIKTRDKENHW